MKKQNIKNVLIIVLVLIEFITMFLSVKSFSNKPVENTKEEVNTKRKQFSMYVENDNGEYEEYTSSNMFPTGYVLNTNKSKCVDNVGQEVKGVLSGNGNKVTITSNKTVFCYVYFDQLSGEDVVIKVSTDGVENTLPSYNKYKQELICNGADAYFSTKFQRIEISQVSKKSTNCTLNYTKDTTSYTLLKDKVESVNTTNNNGYRYSGKQPNNWVWFNNELWRIIGSIPVTLSDGTTVENRVKIIKATSIGGLVYDSNREYTTWGSENTLYTLLNEYYYGKKDATGSSFCLGFSTDAYALCNYTNIGISNDSNDYYRRMILDVYMNVGIVSSTTTTINAAYINETSTLTSNTAKIGLMNISDYGYATSGITYSSAKIGTTSLNGNNNWIYGKGDEWTMTPYSTTNVLSVYSCDDNSCTVKYVNPIYGQAVRPVVYLDSSVYIISGNGTESNPYILGM